MEDYRSAVNSHCEGFELSLKNPDILITLVVLQLRLGESNRAFGYLANALTHDSFNVQTIFAVARMLQNHSDLDVALVKYHVAVVHSANPAQLWNNVGMCFLGKSMHLAVVACLKRTLHLDPFEWIVSYTLGFVHLHTQQFASAFYFLCRNKS